MSEEFYVFALGLAVIWILAWRFHLERYHGKSEERERETLER